MPVPRYAQIIENTGDRYQRFLANSGEEPGVQESPNAKRRFYKKLLVDLEDWGRRTQRYKGENFNNFQKVIERYYIPSQGHEGTYRFGNAIRGGTRRRSRLRRTRRHRH